MIEKIESKAFKQTYEAKPVIFHEATSPHFTCKFAFRQDDTVMQIKPVFQPTRPEFHTILSDAVDSCMGIKKEDAVVEYIDDELIDGPNFYISLKGFGESHRMNQTLVEKILTLLHEKL